MSASRPKKVSPSWSPYGASPFHGQDWSAIRAAWSVASPAILGQDPALEHDQLGARVQAELLAERPACRADRGERVGLPTAAVLRQGEQRPPALAERLLPGEHGAVGRDSCVVTGVEPGLQQVLLGGQSQLTEADGLQPARHPVLELAERRAAPERDGLGQQRDRALGAPRGRVPMGALDEVLELLAVDVELVGAHPVAAVDRLDRVGRPGPCGAG